jgi:hypothetical protein
LISAFRSPRWVPKTSSSTARSSDDRMIGMLAF